MDIDKIACLHKKEKINPPTQNNSTLNNCNCASFDKVLKEQEVIMAKYAVPEYSIPKPTVDDEPIDKYAIPNIDDPVEEDNKDIKTLPLLKYAVPYYYDNKTSPVGKYSIPEPPKPLYAIPNDNK